MSARQDRRERQADGFALALLVACAAFPIAGVVVIAIIDPGIAALIVLLVALVAAVVTVADLLAP